jgi:hypothetical protein
VAIGGISRERALSIVGSADAVAVISELVPSPAGDDGRTASDVLDEVSRRACMLQALFAGGDALAEAAR